MRPGWTRFVPGIATCLLAMVLTLVPPPAQAVPLDARSADPILFWNDQANRAIQATGTDPFQASRALALESIAVFDTMRSINGNAGFLVRLPSPGDVNPEIAVTAAAHSMLDRLFPSRHAVLGRAFAVALDREPAGPVRSRSIGFGEAVADAVLALRDRDGWNGTGSIRTGSAPGQWRPTPPRYLPTLVPQWATLTPFAMTKPDQFRPSGPPPLGSAAFHDATMAVASIGGARSPVRTAAQTEIARYWSDAIGTYAPAGHWNSIAAELLASQAPSLDKEAELFAELNVAMADAGIAIADAKYTYWFWRPVTVITSGGDGSPAIADWSPLLETPNHPSYISGHSGFSGAAATVLTDRFGARGFSFLSASLPGVTRTFASFQQAAEEAAASRMYGGIHFPFDNTDGLVAGRAVGAWTLVAFRRLGEDRGPVIVMDHSAHDAKPETSPVAGFALDNVSPVAAVLVQVDGGVPINVTVDSRGRFAVPEQRLGVPGGRAVVVTVTSSAGRTAALRWQTDGSEDGGTVTAPVIMK
jgi:membrane-associated phospholipid phosphatase